MASDNELLYKIIANTIPKVFLGLSKFYSLTKNFDKGLDKQRFEENVQENRSSDK